MVQAQALLGSPDVRLITLTGPGGAGKTRLSLELARREAEAGRLVRFVPLEDVANAGQIPLAILETLGLTPNPEQEPWEQAALALKEQPGLLILDNIEQVVEEGGPRVYALLEQSPALRVLATSRQPLDISGERELPVPPLPIPQAGESKDHLLACPSVHLFLDRAQAVRPDFQVTDRNAAAVAAVCRRLEGLPLALELAAAWGRTLTPAQMEERLAHRFDLLVSKRKDLSPRHRALRGTIEWSYRMLTPALQLFFAGLSVFRGGWTLEAAQAVCEDSQALEGLEQLRERSLIVAEETGNATGNAMRFRLLEALREFGLEQLSPDERALREQHHADWCLKLAEAGEAGLRGPEAERWLNRLTMESENLDAALDWNERRPDRQEHRLRLCAALALFWSARGLVVEGRRRLEEALRANVSASPPVRAVALFASGHLAAYQNELDVALTRYRESLAVWRELGDLPRIADALLQLGLLVGMQEGQEAACSVLAECLARKRALGGQYGIAQALMAQADAARHGGKMTEATGLYNQALIIFQENGWKTGVGHALGSLGQTAFLQGDYAQARAVYERNLALFREEDNLYALAHCLSMLGHIACEQGNLDTAHACYLESLACFGAAGRQAGVAVMRENLGIVAQMHGDTDAAERLYQESFSSLTQLGASCGIGRLLAFRLAPLALERGRPAEAQRLGEQALALFRSSGNKWDLAAALCARAEVAAALRETEQSRALSNGKSGDGAGAGQPGNAGFAAGKPGDDRCRRGLLGGSARASRAKLGPVPNPGTQAGAGAGAFAIGSHRRPAERRQSGGLSLWGKPAAVAGNGPSSRHRPVFGRIWLPGGRVGAKSGARRPPAGRGGAAAPLPPNSLEIKAAERRGSGDCRGAGQAWRGSFRFVLGGGADTGTAVSRRLCFGRKNDCRWRKPGELTFSLTFD